MKVFDEVVLKYEVAELAERGIRKGCFGDVIAVDGDTCKVVFYAPKIHGDYAVAKVETAALTYKGHMGESYVASFQKFVETLDESGHTRFLDDDVYEYDEVEITQEKEKYSKQGVHKGMVGTVIADYSILNKWLVEFCDEKSGEDIAILEVHRDDFKIIRRS
ncbi:MAG: DUF4926 domain-containing protein [Bacteroides sp.]|nr:DUF4926 domain-containing protein [Bacillota bacterium]MCM1393318.1 DUF4926 domain-containing protein [[Eubacterium] siraeum]MCM1455646.1 DUF4926 domain-containing protein [Bacteroides sp.]